MNATADLVREFYEDIWNAEDDAAVDRLLAPGVTFRGSLGDETRGRDEFRAYVARVRETFGDFHNELEELIGDGDRAAARLTYTGVHRGELFGVPGTGRRISYQGAAFFEASGGVIQQIWVLGDLTGLRSQLMEGDH